MSADTVALPILTSLKLLTVEYGKHNVKKVLVFGAGGFIAGHRIQVLKREGYWAPNFSHARIESLGWRAEVNLAEGFK